MEKRWKEGHHLLRTKCCVVCVKNRVGANTISRFGDSPIYLPRMNKFARYRHTVVTELTVFQYLVVTESRSRSQK
jgi:hypothetical protein